jgi:hypothetical protein
MVLIDRNITCEPPGSGQEGKSLKPPSKATAYDTYYSRLVKLIPSEIIAFYLALDGIASAMKDKETMLWIAFANAVVGGWIYLGRLANVRQFTQRLLTVFGLVIWIYVFGGPFAQFSWYDASYGKFILVLYTFFIPMAFKGSSEKLKDKN